MLCSPILYHDHFKEKTILDEWLLLAILRKEECMPAMDTYILYIYWNIVG